MAKTLKVATMLQLQNPDSALMFGSFAPTGLSAIEQQPRLSASAADAAARQFEALMTTISTAGVKNLTSCLIDYKGGGMGFIGCDEEKKIGDDELLQLISRALITTKVRAHLARLGATAERGQAAHRKCTAATLQALADSIMERNPGSSTSKQDGRLGFVSLLLTLRGTDATPDRSITFFLILPLWSACNRVVNVISALRGGNSGATDGTVLILVQGVQATHQQLSSLLVTPTAAPRVTNRAPAARGQPYTHLSVQEALQELHDAKSRLRRHRGTETPAKVQVQVEELSSDDDSTGAGAAPAGGAAAAGGSAAAPAGGAEDELRVSSAPE